MTVNYISWSSDFAFWQWLLGIMTQYDLMFDLHIPLVLPYISNTIEWIFLLLWLMIRTNTVSDLILIVGQCGLYFMAQWLCLIFLSLLNDFTSYRGKWGWMDDFCYGRLVYIQSLTTASGSRLFGSVLALDYWPAARVQFPPKSWDFFVCPRDDSQGALRCAPVCPSVCLSIHLFVTLYGIEFM